MSDTERLIEEAERLAASFRDPEKKQNLHLAQTLTDLVTALRVERERAEKAEKERDAARAELARLTTPRPIAEAPRDGTWVLLPFSTSKWDACRGPSPQYVTARWFAAAWVDPQGAMLTEPSHYLPLPAEGGQR